MTNLFSKQYNSQQMLKVDFTYPLPTKSLHARYDGIFDAIKKGLNPILVGLPQSSRSAFLKFIIEYDKEFLKEFILPQEFDFIQIETKDVTDNKYISSIAYEIFDDKVIKTNDPLLIMASIKNYLKKSRVDKRIVFVIYEVDKFRNKNPETYKFILELLKINKHKPNLDGFQAVFISSPRDLDTSIADKVVYFNLFNKNEMEYTRKRLEYFRNTKISDEVHSLSSKLSFGHYLLYKSLSDLSAKDLKQIYLLKTHKLVDQLLEDIWKGTADIKQVNKFKPIFNPILLPPVSKSIKESGYKNIIQLTAQERVLFEYLKGKTQTTTRDEIAQTVWGANWLEKYSDWAIDKLVSKLKAKLVYSNYKILTFRNQGYKLTNYDD